MNDIERVIRGALKADGIDLIGFASKDRFEGVDAQHNPFSIFPEGKTVIMISSEMPELLGMCDRIMVMHEGRKMGEMSAEEATQEKIMALCV